MYLFLYFLKLLFSVFQTIKTEEPVRVAVAANAQYAMRELETEFESLSGKEIELIISSSGKLTSQIKAGAPYDILVSADINYPEELYNSGYTIYKPEIYGHGRLVLWCESNLSVKSVTDLELHRAVKIAIANPRHAPYGSAAVEALKYYHLYDKVKNQLVYGESISQVNQFLYTGAAKLGFSSKSVVTVSETCNTGYWIEVNPSTYTPIKQGVVLLKSSKERNARMAEQFYRFLFSPKGKAIFVKYGYDIPQ